MRDTTHQREPRRRRSRRRRLAAAAAGLAGGLLLGACSSTQGLPPDLGLPASTVTVNTIAAAPTEHVGRLVSVSGEINRVFGPRWFSIGGEDFGGQELLVVGPATVPAIVNSLADSLGAMNDVVQVTGYVRMFDEAAIEQEIGAQIGVRWWEPYERRPVLVMTDLDVTPRVDVVAAAAVPVPVPTPVPVPVPVIVDETVIVDAPDRATLAGRAAALIGVTVQAVTRGDRAFWVGPSASRQLFVVADTQSVATRVNVAPGQRVAVAGVLRALPADLATVRSEWKLTPAHEAALMREAVYLDANRIEVMTATGAATGGAGSEASGPRGR